MLSLSVWWSTFALEMMFTTQMLWMRYHKTSQTDMFFRVEFVLHVSIFSHVWAQSVSGVFCVSCVLCACRPLPCVLRKGIFPPFFVTSWQASVDHQALKECRVWMVVDGWVRTPFVNDTGGGRWGGVGAHRYRCPILEAHIPLPHFLHQRPV